MADRKISALSAASTPLAGTEVFPVVQSGTTVKASIANVQAAPVTAGTAYGIQFLNGSKVPSTQGNLQFDGNNLGIGQPATNPAGITTNIELPYGATIAARSNTAAPQLYIMSNALGTGYAPTYAINGYATQYTMQGFDGNHYWSTAPSGTAGAAITFTQRMQLANASGDLTLNTGNLVQGTAAKGINFTANTPAAGMTSQLLNWYEEGTWTPAQGSGLTVVGAFSSSGTYTRIGRQVTVSGTVTGATSVAVAAAGIVTTNLPFTVVTAGHGNATNAAVNASAAVICTTTNVTSANAIAATGTITFSATYFV